MVVCVHSVIQTGVPWPVVCMYVCVCVWGGGGGGLPTTVAIVNKATPFVKARVCWRFSCCTNKV